MVKRKTRIYLAAPLFSQCERWWNLQVCERLENQFQVYLPQRDGQLFTEMVRAGEAIASAKETVFSRDLWEIDRCDVLLIVMDGRAIDEGAAFELGYAFARSKVNIGLKTDTRTLLTMGNNPMIEQALSQIFEDVESTIAWIERRFPDDR